MSHPTGTPVWIDLATDDLATAKTFYEQLLGWEFEDSGSTFMHYNMIRKDGGFVGGAMDIKGMKCPDGSEMPSNWGVYLAVDDVDARAKLAADNDGTVVVEPQDAGGAGRFAVVTDPSGAAIGLWRAGDIDSFDFSGKPGTPAWFELMTQDLEKVKQFYATVFDYDLTPMEGSDGSYFTNGPQESASSGICNAQGFIPAEMGSFWRWYVVVEDCDKSAEKLTSLGGKVLDGPEDTPFGRIATVADPTGASFQIVSGGPAQQADGEGAN